jgi:aspartate-semialdehyde dehydrogenase
VPVLEGHTEAVFVGLGKPATVEEVAAAMRGWGGELLGLGLPSAPKRLIVVHEDPFRPQPRLDRDAEQGMATTVGRIRKDGALANGIKYVLVSHNTKMGAARGAVLIGEYLLKKGYVG